MAHYQRILYHYQCNFIVWIGWQAPSPGQVVQLLLATTQTYKHGDHEPCCQFHGAQYQADLNMSVVSCHYNLSLKILIENLK